MYSSKYIAATSDRYLTDTDTDTETDTNMGTDMDTGTGADTGTDVDTDAYTDTHEHMQSQPASMQVVLAHPHGLHVLSWQ